MKRYNLCHLFLPLFSIRASSVSFLCSFDTLRTRCTLLLNFLLFAHFAKRSIVERDECRINATPRVRVSLWNVLKIYRIDARNASFDICYSSRGRYQETRVSPVYLPCFDESKHVCLSRTVFRRISNVLAQRLNANRRIQINRRLYRIQLIACS